MILFKTPHSKKFVLSDRQAGLAWPGWPCRFCGCASSSSFNNCYAVFNACTTCPKWFARVPPLPTCQLCTYMYIRKNTLATFSWPFYNHHCMIVINKFIANSKYTVIGKWADTCENINQSKHKICRSIVLVVLI